MKKSVSVWLLVAALFSALSANAGPGKPFTGTITYTINMSGNIPAEMKGMLPNKAHYQVSDNKVRIDMEPSVTGAGAIITDYNKRTMRMQLDIPGARYQMIMDEEMQAQEGSITNIEYLKDTRKIAGYDCQKAIVTGMEGDKTEVWFAEKIQVEGQDKMWGKLKGFPMEFSKTNQGITMHYTASAVKQGKVDSKVFEMPEDYQPITQEQLMQLFGGGMD